MIANVPFRVAVTNTGRALLLKVLLQPLDFSFKWVNLCLKVQQLRLEILYQRFLLYKLPIERKHLSSLLNRE